MNNNASSELFCSTSSSVLHFLQASDRHVYVYCSQDQLFYPLNCGHPNLLLAFIEAEMQGKSHLC